MEIFFSLITEILFIAIFQNDELIGKLQEDIQGRHSELFIRKMEFLLSKSNCILRDVSKIFFLRGPGGQTGERISYSFVTAILQAKSSVEIYSLDSLTFQNSYQDRCISAMIVGKNTKRYYVNVYNDNSLVLSKKGILLSEFEDLKISFSELPLEIDLRKSDFILNFQLLKDKFQIFTTFNEMEWQ